MRRTVIAVGVAIYLAIPPVRAQDVTSASTAPADAEAVRSLVERYLADAEAKRKSDKENAPLLAESAPTDSRPTDPKAVSELHLETIWDRGVIFLTPNKDWRIHFGGRLQFDNVWWKQPEFLKGPPPGNGGVPAQGPFGGVGALDDGFFFRRVRLRSDGTGYELVEYMVELNFENLNQITYDGMWVGFKDVPFLGTIRIGQQKVPQGLEMLSSDYHQVFLERSALADAFWSLFAPGLLVANNYLDQRISAQTMLHRVQPNQIYNGAAFGDGNYATTSRLTGLPIYRDEGQYLVHVGGSYQWRTGNLGRTIGGTGDVYADTQDVVRFRARPELRDAIGVGSVPGIGGDPARFVDTGFLLSDHVQTLGPELLCIWGPLSLQSEAAFACASNVRSIYPAAAFNQPRGNPTFWGGYVQVAYLLTGEHRGYDRRLATLDRPKVNRNFFIKRGQDGCIHCGPGAWEVGYRFSFVDLNDNGIGGGQLTEHTIGLNWYFNDNFKMQANYINIQRTVAAPANSGTIHGVGILTQWYF